MGEREPLDLDAIRAKDWDAITFEEIGALCDEVERLRVEMQNMELRLLRRVEELGLRGRKLTDMLRWVLMEIGEVPPQWTDAKAWEAAWQLLAEVE